MFSRLQIVPERIYFGVAILAGEKNRKLQEVKSKELPDPTRRHLSLLTISLAHRIAHGEEEWIMP